MSGSHRSLSARHIGPLLAFVSDMESCLSWEIFLIFIQKSSTLSNKQQPSRKYNVYVSGTLGNQKVGKLLCCRWTEALARCSED